MTIKEISATANCGETTVRRWAETASAKMADISAKMAKARETSVAAEFTLPETIAIIRAGGNDTLADLLAMNAEQKVLPRAREATKLPNGKQIEMLARIYGSAEAAKRMDFIIGYKAVPDALVKAVTSKVQLQIPDRNPAAVEETLRPVIQQFSAEVQKNMLGAGYAAAKREVAKRVQWDQNGKLFEGGQS